MAFHLIISLQTAVIAMSYYAMATGSGKIYITAGVEHHHTSEGDYDVVIIRQVFFTRFIEYIFSTPLVLLSLALLAGLAWIDIFTVIVVDELMVVCVLMGGVTTESWCVIESFLYVFGQLR
jgi:bacteriorhodopsin